ncbi:MAG: type II toxin-antitoxin system RelB/DinJ family antitoxin [Lautropia sp.]|nr:type II toxin-antitoxin system RelB/DinJ family antitoxin [Lautropia sp.]
MPSTMVHVRLDEQTKTQAAAALADMGLTLSDAIRVFLTRVAADKALPFALKVPNAATLTAMSEAEEIIRHHQVQFDTAEALIDDLKKNSAA